MGKCVRNLKLINYYFRAYDWWLLFGIPSGGVYGDKNSCQPYFLPECKHYDQGPEEMKPCGDPEKTPVCVNECVEGFPTPLRQDVIVASEVYPLWGGESEMMEEIKVLGSITATFSVYEDFLTYKTGIYQHVTGDYIGGQSVRIIGWGIENVRIKY